MLTRYFELFNDFHPKLINFENHSLLVTAFKKTNILVYGEIHGMQEDAHVLYTLCKNLGIKQLAIECPAGVRAFIDSGINGNIDFSLIDPDVFESSILSIEVASTIVTLFKEGILTSIAYIDSYFDEQVDTNVASPQSREELLAKNFLALDGRLPTLCAMGQWHTQLEPSQHHTSALYRIRQVKPEVLYVHSVYKSGNLYNDGKVITLPVQDSLPNHYVVRQRSEIDFEQVIPIAHRINI